MKRSFLLLVAVTLFSLTFVRGNSVNAEACYTEGDQASASIQVPVLAKLGAYTVWTRMQTPDAGNIRLQLEINDNTCFIVFNDGPVNEWSWVKSSGTRLDAKDVTYNFTSTTDNKIDIIAIDDGVKVDRILVLQDSCVPEGTGDNCRAGATTLPIQASTASIEQDPSGPISGKVFVAKLLTQTSKDVSKVQYFANGKKIQESRQIAPLDTTLVDNGIHTITTRIFWADGTSEDIVNTVTIKNPLTTFSPLNRWIRLNKRLLLVAGFILAFISVFLLVLSMARIAQNRSRKRSAHGFN